MKTLQEIKQDKQNKVDTLLNETHVFWAFSNEQFAKGLEKTPLQEGEKVVSIGAGGYMPKSKVNMFLDGMSNINAEYKAALKVNKMRKQNIAYELANHEAYYTMDITDTLSALGEDYTREEVHAVWMAERKKQVLQD